MENAQGAANGNAGKGADARISMKGLAITLQLTMILARTWIAKKWISSLP